MPPPIDEKLENTQQQQRRLGERITKTAKKVVGLKVEDSEEGKKKSLFNFGKGADYEDLHNKLTAVINKVQLVSETLDVPEALTQAEKLYAESLASGMEEDKHCLLYTSPSPRDRQKSRMPSSA